MNPFIILVLILWSVIGGIAAWEFFESNDASKYTFIGSTLMVLLFGPICWLFALFAVGVTLTMDLIDFIQLPKILSSIFVKEEYRSPEYRDVKVPPQKEDIAKEETPPENTKMLWANEHVWRLQKGETVEFRPVGKSMTGKIESGQLVTVAPVQSLSKLEISLKVGDIVLCEVNNRHYVHLIKKITKEGYTIGNNRGKINGVISLNEIYGLVTNIED